MNSTDISITIRPAIEKDIFELTSLSEQLGYPTLEDIIRLRLDFLLEHPSHMLLVALNPQNEVIGWIHGYLSLLLIADPHVELGGLVIDEAYRGNGIGEELLGAIETWALDIGVQSIFVRSNIIRKNAHRFYERLGYILVKTSKTFEKKLALK